MAILTANELAACRRTLRDILPGDEVIDFTKPEVNALFQVLEDEYQDRKITVSGAVDTATNAGGELTHIFTNAHKKKAGAAYYNWRFLQDKT